MSRFVKLQPFLVELFARPEWSRKPGLAKAKFREADWDLMAKLVTILQVTQRQHTSLVHSSAVCRRPVYYSAWQSLIV